VFEAAVRAVRRSGLPEYRRAHCGHGIGLQLYDAPLLGPRDETVLEPGMVVNIEVPCYELGFGGMQLEDTAVVTDGTPLLLTHAPRDLAML
jgi:Xaa-Pro dipeptidase